MMPTKSHITVISLTVSMILFITENVQAMGVCETELKAFGYSGQLDHDTHFFEIKSFTAIPWIPKYRVFINFLKDKIFSTNTDLVAVHCNNVETLFHEGFTGALPIDKVIPDNTDILKKTNNELVAEYISFYEGTPYSEYKDKVTQFKFDLVYEFALKRKIKTTEEGIPCKSELKEEKYTGNFVHDFLSFVKKHGKTPFGEEPADAVEDKSFVGRYKRFMFYAKDFVLFTENNIMDVYCDLLAPLRDEGFTGKLQHDLEYAETFKNKPNHKLKEEVKIYEGYLENVDEGAYAAAGIKYPDSFLAQFGLTKLGKIMY